MYAGLYINMLLCIQSVQAYPTSSRTAQTQIHKGTVIHRQPPLLLDIPLPERLCEMLDRDARHQEPIKRHPTRARIVFTLRRGISLLQFAHKITW